MTTRTSRRLLAALTVLLTTVLLGGAAAPAQADPKDRVTFGVGPGGQAFVDTRPFMVFGAGPDSTLVDRVAVYNQSNTPLDLLVYASDATNNKSGGVDVKPRSMPNTDMGSWVVLGDDPVTASRPNRQILRVHVPAQSSTRGIGKVVLPMRIVVPKDASPGDHVAGVVAALISKGASSSSQNIELEQRVALRLYLRVAGDLRPQLGVTIISADYQGGGGLGLGGTTRIRYQMRNTGNVRLTADTEVKVASLLGLGSTTVTNKRVEDLLPGGSAEQTIDVAGTPPSILQTASVTVSGSSSSDVGAVVKARPASDSVRVWAVTWQEVVALVLLVAALVYGRRRRRRTPTSAGRHAKSSSPVVQPAGVGVVLLVTAAVAALLTVASERAHAQELGQVGVRPAAGNAQTIFFGYLSQAQCPTGTTDSYWTVDGPDVPKDTAFLGPGSTTGTGPQQFRGASVANIRTTTSGAFQHDGTYHVRFSCVSPDGTVRSSYATALQFTASTGAWKAATAAKVPDFVLDTSIPSPAPAGTGRPLPTASTSSATAGTPPPSATTTADGRPSAGPEGTAAGDSASAQASSTGSDVPSRAVGAGIAGGSLVLLALSWLALRARREQDATP